MWFETQSLFLVSKYIQREILKNNNLWFYWQLCTLFLIEQQCIHPPGTYTGSQKQSVFLKMFIYYFTTDANSISCLPGGATGHISGHPKQLLHHSSGKYTSSWHHLFAGTLAICFSNFFTKNIVLAILLQIYEQIFSFSFSYSVSLTEACWCYNLKKEEGNLTNVKT